MWFSIIKQKWIDSVCGGNPREQLDFAMYHKGDERKDESVLECA